MSYYNFIITAFDMASIEINFNVYTSLIITIKLYEIIIIFIDWIINYDNITLCIYRYIDILFYIMWYYYDITAV